MNCWSEDKYLSKGNKCCDRCAAGTFVRSDCDGTTVTQCDKCPHKFYTATKNHLMKCQPCTDCSAKNNQRKSKDCSASANTECECETGFYCSDDQCAHCTPVTQCPVGEGVQVAAGRTRDAVCAPCREGTYSNVTDFISRCKAHTRCEDIGRELKSQGTKTADAVCGDVFPRCSWMLPAGLWAGLVLTALVLLAIVVCWRAKRKSLKVRSRVPVTAEVAPAAPPPLPDLSLPSTELNGHCQESCATEECKLTLYSPDEDLVSCDVDISLPITPLKVCVAFADSPHQTGYRSSSFHRSPSEPQEDEWCDT